MTPKLSMTMMSLPQILMPSSLKSHIGMFSLNDVFQHHTSNFTITCLLTNWSPESTIIVKNLNPIIKILPRPDCKKRSDFMQS